MIEDLIRDRNDLFKSNDPRSMKKSLSSEVLNYSLTVVYYVRIKRVILASQWNC